MYLSSQINTKFKRARGLTIEKWTVLFESCFAVLQNGFSPWLDYYQLIAFDVGEQKCSSLVSEDSAVI